MPGPARKGRAPTAVLLAAAAAMLLAGSASAQRAGGLVRSVRADLAEAAAGRYTGHLAADAGGSPRSGVLILVTRIGPNQVRVTSDPPRLPAFTALLTRASRTIRNSGGEEMFVLDVLSKPPTLTVRVAGATWSGTKQGALQ